MPVADAAAPPPVRPTILVIEDNPYLSESLTKFLRNHGWEPVAAADLIDARRYIHSGARDVPDVYLIDLKLPGAPGSDIVRAIRLAGLRSTRTRELPRIVAYTCLDVSDAKVAAAIEAGANAVVQKSSDIDHLIAVCEGNHPGDVPIPDRPR